MIQTVESTYVMLRGQLRLFRIITFPTAILITVLLWFDSGGLIYRLWVALVVFEVCWVVGNFVLMIILSIRLTQLCSRLTNSEKKQLAIKYPESSRFR